MNYTFYLDYRLRSLKNDFFVILWIFFPPVFLSVCLFANIFFVCLIVFCLLLFTVCPNTQCLPRRAFGGSCLISSLFADGRLDVFTINVVVSAYSRSMRLSCSATC